MGTRLGALSSAAGPIEGLAGVGFKFRVAFLGAARVGKAGAGR